MALACRAIINCSMVEKAGTTARVGDYQALLFIPAHIGGSDRRNICIGKTMKPITLNTLYTSVHGGERIVLPDGIGGRQNLNAIIGNQVNMLLRQTPAEIINIQRGKFKTARTKN
ncbi:hypothetical protein HBA55_27330 [Pseudomaricurvus alkylphenolicus]|nr:hypothetical protein [Pseudomaricurvus alkylphenolicus]NIB43351.1 hypothetical protein [Pseudomaricurvus alkylphenolicus]